MLPAVKHHTTWTKIGVRGIDAIKAIGYSIATFIALGNDCSANRREVRTILVREACIG
jgi:hypothetical protein